MHIFWICAGSIDQIGNRVTSKLASTRYRVIIPAEKLAARGYGNTLILTNAPNFSVEGVEFDRCDVMVVSKSFSDVSIKLVYEAKKRGIPVVVDSCDNYYLIDEYKLAYSTLIDLADVLVSSTQGIHDVIRTEAGRESYVIGDPYESNKGIPAFSPANGIRLLWFGHPSSYNGVAEFIPLLREKGVGCAVALKVVTMDVEGIGEKIRLFNRKLTGDLKLSFRPWSMEAVSEELASTDIVIIPVQKAEFNQVKSANRLIESMWAGRFVVATPIASYREFSDFANIDDDIVAGIRQAIENREQVVEKIINAQHYIERCYSPDVIADKWELALSKGTKTNLNRNCNSVDRGGPVKLNLGCGDKILAGYLNVDVAPARNGKKPDIICDLRDLKPFASDSVDEILSVHVIEHFWRWEALDVLKEWVRVLKPGGKMIVECPNIVTACQSLLEDTDRRAGTGTDGQSTMWVFYGDPAWKDPLMTHRWGYTPASLMRLLEEAGLESVRQEPAQFKMREPRDMRITGKKRVV